MDCVDCIVREAMHRRNPARAAVCQNVPDLRYAKR